MKVAIIISSCDAYSHCWLPMLHSLHLHWPDCPFPVYVVSNEKEMEDEHFVNQDAENGNKHSADKACILTEPDETGNRHSADKSSILTEPDETGNRHSADKACVLTEPSETGNRHSANKASFLKVGPDRGWGPNLAKALGFIDYDYIIYLQDDYFLDQRVDTALLMQHFEYCQRQQVDYLRLSWPFQDRHRAEEWYCYDQPKFRYALCLQAAIWRKSLLQQLSGEVISGWDFERTITRIIASKKISVNARVLHSSAFPTAGIAVVEGTAIRKGLWTVDGARYLAENGFSDLLPLRKVEGWLTTRLMQVKNPILKVPAAIVLRGMKKLLRLA